MLQSTTIDSRRTDLNRNLDARPADIGTATQSDFARGQRSNLVRALVDGDFAAGMRTASRPTLTGDFATGMWTSYSPVTMGDFATGMRTVPVAVIVADRTSDLDRELPLAA
jgi:hypothetical protein